jgi:hypothetical protein
VNELGARPILDTVAARALTAIRRRADPASGRSLDRAQAGPVQAA